LNATATAKPSLMQRVVGAARVLRGVTLDQHELSHFFGRGLGVGGVPEVRDAYSKVGVVYGCVRVRAEAISSLPLMVSAADDQVLESGPVVELIECPMPGMTRRAFWDATSSLLDLFGSVHWRLSFDTGGFVVGVEPIAPPLMRPKRSRGGQITAWHYTVPGRTDGRHETLSPDEVWTIVDPDFDDARSPMKGMSPRVAVSLAIRQYVEADVANAHSLLHGVGGGMVATAQGTLSEQQRQNLGAELRERYSGGAHRHQWIITEGGLEVKPMSPTFKDMEFTELKKMSRADICAAYRVPGPLLSYFEDSNYAHATAAERLFYVGTILPRAMRLAEEWDMAVLSRSGADRSLRAVEARRRSIERREAACQVYRSARRAAARTGRRFYSWFDSSGVPAVQAAKLELTEQASKWWTMGTPLNHLYQAFDVPLPDVPHGNDGYRAISLEPYGTDTLDTIDDPDGGSPEPALLPESEPEGGDGGRSGSRASLADAEAVRATEATRAKLWALWRKSWAGLENAARARVHKHFFELRAEVLGNLERLSAEIALAPGSDAGKAAELRGRVKFYPDKKRDVIGELLFDLGPAGDKLLATLRPLIRGAHQLGGEQSMKEAADAQGSDEPEPFNLRDPRLDALIRGRENKLRDVDSTLHKRLAAKIAGAIDAGKTVNEIADTIRGEFNFAGKRAQVIARTEIGAAVEESRHVGREQAGVPLKSWLHSRKETGRPSHIATERDTTANPIANTEDFLISGTGVSAPHPRATGRPEHDINCSCSTLARHPGDSIKAVMSRYSARGFLTWEALQARNLKNPQGKDAKPCPNNTTD